jgi:hypothetical protein
MNRIRVILFVLAIASTLVRAQVQLSGETSTYVLKSAVTASPRVVNNGNPTFGWRFDLFLDAKVTDNVFVLADVRSLPDEVINFDYLAVRMLNVGDLGFNAQMGKFDMPFGNLADRRFPTKNFLYGLPLIYEYRTSLPDQVPTRAEVLGGRSKGVGMRLVDLGIYDIGAMIYGDAGKAHYAVAVANGTISSTYIRHLNADGDFNKIIRCTYTPIMGLTVGASAAMSAYLSDEGRAIPRDKGSSHYQQLITEVDVDFSRDRFLFNGEAVYSRWTVPFENEDTDLWAIGYYVEAKYTWFPRFYTAARVSGLIFSRIQLEGISPRWDNNMVEVEAGIGYHLERNTLVKLVRRETRTLEVTGPKDNLTVLQVAVSF